MSTTFIEVFYYSIFQQKLRKKVHIIHRFIKKKYVYHVQVNNYEIFVKNFYVSHNLT